MNPLIKKSLKWIKVTTQTFKTATLKQWSFAQGFTFLLSIFTQTLELTIGNREKSPKAKL